MLFDEIKNELTRKVCELKLWLANIDERNQYCNITKGLYFVYMYGIYEESELSLTLSLVLHFPIAFHEP